MRTLTTLTLMLAVVGASASLAQAKEEQRKPPPISGRTVKKAQGRHHPALPSDLTQELRQLRSEIAIMRRQIQDMYDYADAEVHFRQSLKARAQASRMRLTPVCEVTDENLTSLGCASPKAAVFAVITGDGGARIYDAHGQAHGYFKQKDETITAMAFSPDGKLLLSGTGTGHLLIWDLAVKTCEVVPAQAETSITQVAWLSGTERIAWRTAVTYYGEGQTAINREKPSGAVVSRSTGTTLWEFQTSARGDFQPLTASPGGKRLAILELLGKARGVFVLDGATGAPVSTLFHQRHSSGPLSAAMAPDGKTVAVGYAPYDVILWNGESGELLRILTGHTNWVSSLGFSSDGRFLVSGGGDSTARVWSVATGKELGRLVFEGSSTYVNSVGFSPDGKVVFALADGKLVIAKTPVTLAGVQ